MVGKGVVPISDTMSRKPYLSNRMQSGLYDSLTARPQDTIVKRTDE